MLLWLWKGKENLMVLKLTVFSQKDDHSMFSAFKAKSRFHWGGCEAGFWPLVHQSWSSGLPLSEPTCLSVTNRKPPSLQLLVCPFPELSRYKLCVLEALFLCKSVWLENPWGVFDLRLLEGAL